jgi:hypothetical protein
MISNFPYAILDGVPGPGSVELRGIFDKGTPKSKAFTFGVSREHYNKVYVEGSVQVDPVVPGPGRYKVPSVIGREGQIVSIKGRNKLEKNHGKYMDC